LVASSHYHTHTDQLLNEEKDKIRIKQKEEFVRKHEHTLSHADIHTSIGHKKNLR